MLLSCFSVKKISEIEMSGSPREDNKVADDLKSLSISKQESNSNVQGREKISYERNTLLKAFLEVHKRYEKSPVSPLKTFIELCLSSFKCSYGR